MRYKKMHKTGVEVSEITVGTWAIGGASSTGSNYGEVDDERSIEAIRAMLAGGVNLIDTAPIYGEGHSEKVVGRAIEGLDRSKILVATKFGEFADNGTTRYCSEPSCIARTLEQSLKSLGTDYLDMYIMHWPDREGTPLEETMRYVNSLKEQGIVRMLGISNFGQELMEEACELADIDIVQLPFSMVNMSAISKMQWCEAHDIDVMTYGSLGAGILTGGIRELPEFDEKDFRLTFYPFYREPLFSKIMEFLTTMDVLAEKYGKPLAQIAINWNSSKSFVTTSLTGVRDAAEAAENCAAFEWQLEPEDVALLDAELDRLGITEAVS